MTNEGEPLKNTATIGKESMATSATVPALTPAEFKAAIQSKLQAAQ
jgi:hypothetical protein